MRRRYERVQARPDVEVFEGKWYPLVKYMSGQAMVGWRPFPEQNCATREEAAKLAVKLAAMLNADPRRLPQIP